MNDKEINLAFSRFNAFRAHLPTEIKEETVVEYHSIVDAIAVATGETVLDQFKIADGELKQKVTGAQRGAYGGGPGRTFYSKDRYCNTERFQRRIQGLANYLAAQRFSSRKSLQDDNPYHLLNDVQIDEIAVGRGIGPKRVVDASGEHFEWDRTYMIAALIKDDRRREGVATSPVSNYVHVEHMHNSALVQGSPGSTINQQFDMRSDDFKNFVANLRRMLAEVPLTDTDRAQTDADLSTVEAQIASPRPKHSVVRECMISVRSILEGAVGSLIASGLIASISHYFPR